MICIKRIRRSGADVLLRNNGEPKIFRYFVADDRAPLNLTYPRFAQQGYFVQTIHTVHKQSLV